MSDSKSNENNRELIHSKTNLLYSAFNLISKWHPSWVLSLVFLAIVGIFVASEVGLLKQWQSKITVEQTICELIEYEKLKDKMSITEVRVILQDRGIEIYRSGTLVILVWQKNDVKITAKFKDDKLIEKNQESSCHNINN